MNMQTPVDAVFPYLDRVDDVMLMSIEPGWSGQTLDPGVYPRIEAVRAEVDRRGLPVDVEIDGGVKIDNARRAVEAGATVLISAQRRLPGRGPDRARAGAEGHRGRRGA